MALQPIRTGGSSLVRDPGRFFLARAVTAELGVHLFVFDPRSRHGLPPYPARPAQTRCLGATFSRSHSGSPPTMTQFGYTAMGEQTPARQLITDLVAAEAAGFDFSVTSDHYFPWLEEQGPLAERLGCARRGGSGDRATAADDVRDLPDVPLPPRGGSAAGGHRRRAVRRQVHPRPRRRGEPQRARHRRRLAHGQGPAR